MDLPSVFSDPIVGGVLLGEGVGLTKLLAGWLARRGVDAVLGDAQERALANVCDRAVQRAVAEAVRVEADADWLDELAASLAAALDDPDRLDGLMRASRGELSAEAEQRWRAAFLCALSESRDIANLEETVDVGRLLDVFSAAFWDELAAAAAKDGSPLAPLWNTAVLRRILQRLDPGQLPRLSVHEARDRLTDYLREVEARTASDPRSPLTASIWTRSISEYASVEFYSGPSTGPTSSVRTTPIFPRGFTRQISRRIDWWTAVRETPHLVVLGEPGYGKTWLFRHEARRLAVTSLSGLQGGEDPEQVPIPVWLRLDAFVGALSADATRRSCPKPWSTRCATTIASPPGSSVGWKSASPPEDASCCSTPGTR